MGGFECADHINRHGNRIDLLNKTGHLQQAATDYRLLKNFSITTVREGIRWSAVEPTPYTYDWSSVASLMAAGQAAGIQQVWDICHFGFPDDLSPLHPHFTKRFVALCRAFVLFYRSQNLDAPLIVTPINEVSFLAWLGGDAKGTVPFCNRQGWKVKYELMRAYVQGIAALKEADPQVRILTTEPLVNIVPPLQATAEQITEAKQHHQNQFQVLDILSGRLCPELGGRPDYLDILGFNFYYNNQWVTGFEQFLPWANTPADPRWRPLSSLLEEAYARYQLPMVLSETSHPGEHRPQWLHFITTQCAALLKNNLPFWGICLYPIIDRPDWDDLSYWHHAGLWDTFHPSDQDVERTLCEPYAAALQAAQRLITKAKETPAGFLLK